MRTVICLTLALMSCAPLPGDGEPGQAGQPGGAGERGPAGRDGKDAVAGGSRLKPLVLIGADGSRVTGGAFYDTERRERCYLQTMPGARDDMERVCAPLGFNPADAGRYVRFLPSE